MFDRSAVAPLYSDLKDMRGRIFTIPNQITMLRLLIAPIFAFAAFEGRFDVALMVALLAAASDFADGWTARRFHLRSEFGVVLDPIADKVLMSGAYLILAFCSLLPWWLTWLVLIRDGAIVGGAVLMMLFSGYRPLPPTLAGKASTFSQLAAVLAAVGWKAHVPLVMSFLVQGCIYLAGGMTVISGIHYLIIGRQRLLGRAGNSVS
jgi:cardiolipin synthase (CMP-forming)